MRVKLFKSGMSECIVIDTHECVMLMFSILIFQPIPRRLSKCAGYTFKILCVVHYLME